MLDPRESRDACLGLNLQPGVQKACPFNHYITGTTKGKQGIVRPCSTAVSPLKLALHLYGVRVATVYLRGRQMLTPPHTHQHISCNSSIG